MYELNDATNEIDLIKLKIDQNLKNYAIQNNKEMMADMLKARIYAEEVWANIAKWIALADDLLKSIDDISDIMINNLIRRTRRDIFFFK